MHVQILELIKDPRRRPVVVHRQGGRRFELLEIAEPGHVCPLYHGKKCKETKPTKYTVTQFKVPQEYMDKKRKAQPDTKDEGWRGTCYGYWHFGDHGQGCGFCENAPHLRKPTKKVPESAVYTHLDMDLLREELKQNEAGAIHLRHVSEAGKDVSD